MTQQEPDEPIVRPEPTRRRTGVWVALICLIAAGAVAVVVIGGADAEPTLSTASDPAPTLPSASPAYSSTLSLQLDEEPPLPCPLSEQRGVSLDLPGPGQPDPASAVALVDDAQLAVVDDTDDATTAVVVALTSDHQVARSHTVILRADGWWPDSYVECRRRPGQ